MNRLKPFCNSTTSFLSHTWIFQCDWVQIWWIPDVNTSVVWEEVVAVMMILMGNHWQKCQHNVPVFCHLISEELACVLEVDNFSCKLFPQWTINFFFQNKRFQGWKNNLRWLTLFSSCISCYWEKFCCLIFSFLLYGTKKEEEEGERKA